MRLKSNVLWRSIFWNRYFSIPCVALTWLWLAYDTNWYDHVWFILWFLSPAPPHLRLLSVVLSKQSIYLIPVTPDERRRSKIGMWDYEIKNSDDNCCDCDSGVPSGTVEVGMSAGCWFPQYRSTSAGEDSSILLPFFLPWRSSGLGALYQENPTQMARKESRENLHVQVTKDPWLPCTP